MRRRAIESETRLNEERTITTDLRMQLERSRAAGGSSAAQTLRITQLEERLLTLQGELTDVYRIKSDNAQTALDLGAKVKALEGQIEAKTKECEAINTERSSISEAKRRLEEQLQEHQLTIQVLHDELQALQLEMVKGEEKIASLEHENKELIDRWMHKAAEDANKMNEANSFYETMKKGLAGAALLFQADGEMRPRTKSKGTLDSPSFAGGSELPTVAKRRWPAHDSEVNAVAFSARGNHLITGGNDCMVKVWDVQTGQMKMKLHGSSQAVMAVAMSSAEDSVIGAGFDNACRLWTMSSGRVRHTMTGHTGKIFGVVFSGDGKRAVTGSHDRTLKVWDLNRGFCTRTIFCYSSCNDLCLSLDGGAVWSAHMDGHLRFWDMGSGDCAMEIKELHKSQVTSVSMSSEGNMLLTNSRDNCLKLVDLRNYQELRAFRAEGFKTGFNWSRSTFSPDGRFVAAGSANGSLFVWSALTGKLETQITPQRTSAIAGCVWNPSGRGVVTCERDKCVTLFA